MALMEKWIGLLLCCFAIDAQSNDEVRMTLVGYISPVCGLTSQNNNLQFSSDGLASTKLVINCNSPMRVSIQSENGGLRHEQSTQITTYNFNWSMDGKFNDLSATASELKSTHTFNVNEILFNSIAKLQLKLEKPLIFAGAYKDVIRIEMTPSVTSGGVW